VILNYEWPSLRLLPGKPAGVALKGRQSRVGDEGEGGKYGVEEWIVNTLEKEARPKGG